MKIAVIADLPLKTGNLPYNANILYNIINDMVVQENADAILFPAWNLSAPCSNSFLFHPQVQRDTETAVSALKLTGMGDILFTLNTTNKSSSSNTPINVTTCIHGGSECMTSASPMGQDGSFDYSGFLLKSNLKEYKDSLLFCPTAIPFHRATHTELDLYAIERSKHTNATFLLVNAGFIESTSGAVYLPHIALAKKGKLLSSQIDHFSPFIFEFNLPCFAECSILPRTFPAINMNYAKLARLSNPFTEKTKDELLEIFTAQVAALSGRMESSHAKKLVVGISGGLDSTLALLVSVAAASPENVLAISMPGFGTSTHTKNNAETLSKSLGCQFRTINITKACRQHFRDIGHDPSVADVVFENSQARERTQILMDIANQSNALVVGTGDLSEIALGWCTYNGDHMSMYGVNSTVPKTLVRAIVNAWAEHTPDIAPLLHDIINTPVSPELLPIGKKNINSPQATEDIIGSYELHDFFLFHYICLQEGPEDIFISAKKVFAKKYSTTQIKNTLKIFFRRFFAQQFKRSCMPDAPQVTPVSLSAHGGFYMPSDIDPDIWTEILETL